LRPELLVLNSKVQVHTFHVVKSDEENEGHDGDHADVYENHD